MLIRHQRRNFDGKPLLRGLAHAGSYLLWSGAAQLLSLTLITYFLSLSRAPFQEISEAYASLEVPLVGFFAVAYLFLLKWLHPLSSTTREELITQHRIERRYIPGFGNGLILALALTGAFLLSGQYEFLGLFLKIEETPLTLGSMLIRALSIVGMVYAEEFIFRGKVLNHFRQAMPDLWAAALSALLYCAVKAVQFDLGWMHLATLFALSLALSIRSLADGDFVRSAGLGSGLLVTFHVLLSLPIFGSEFQGSLIIRYVDQTGTASSASSRFLTGGIGGPLSSFGLQILFLLDFIQGALRHRRFWLKP